MAQDPVEILKAPTAQPTEASPFWRKPLAALTAAEWESLCDGCGRCCLVKLEDEDNGDILFTDVRCKLLDAGSCRCSDYAHRQAHVPDCLKLTPELVASIDWLPPTCAYRLVKEGRDLMWWHPLVSGRSDTVHVAGISVRGRETAAEDRVELEDLPSHIVSWPTRWPKKSRRPLALSRAGPAPAPRSGGEPPAGQNSGDPIAMGSEP